MSVGLHLVLLGSFAAVDQTVNTGNTSLSIEFRESTAAASTPARRQAKAGSYISSKVESVAVNSSAPPAPASTDVAATAEAAVFAAAGDQSAPQSVRDAYVMRLRGMIEKNKSYPIRARQLGLSGKVVVSFTILEDGHVTDVKVEKPCHHNILNQHAVEIVEHIESFEPIPKELGLSHWHLTVPIEFALN